MSGDRWAYIKLYSMLNPLQEASQIRDFVVCSPSWCIRVLGFPLTTSKYPVVHGLAPLAERANIHPWEFSNSSLSEINRTRHSAQGKVRPVLFVKAKGVYFSCIPIQMKIVSAPQGSRTGGSMFARMLYTLWGGPRGFVFDEKILAHAIYTYMYTDDLTVSKRGDGWRYKVQVKNNKTKRPWITLFRISGKICGVCVDYRKE